MALTNFETKEINCKILYLGPSGSGKSENLRSIYMRTSGDVAPAHSHNPPSTLYFDFLPLSVGQVGEFQVKMHLYSLPLHSPYETLKSVVVRGVDGFVFVADSRLEMLEENMDCYKEALKLLKNEGYNPYELARAIQYNKRDLHDIVARDLLSKELNPSSYPEQEAVASQSMGTMETLTQVSRQVLRKLAQAQHNTSL